MITSSTTIEFELLNICVHFGVSYVRGKINKRRNLFILCMDYLAHLIEEKCATKAWNPMKTSRNGPSFSHLFFASDLVYLLRRTRKIVLLLMKLFRSSVLDLVSKLAKPNIVYSSRLMWTLTKEIFCLTFLVLALLTTLASIWASL